MCRLNTIKRLLRLPQTEETSEILSRISKDNVEAQERAFRSFEHAETVQDETKQAAEELSAAARNIRHASAATIMRIRALQRASQS